jgi:hypothetical protein
VDQESDMDFTADEMKNTMEVNPNVHSIWHTKHRSKTHNHNSIMPEITLKTFLGNFFMKISVTVFDTV